MITILAAILVFGILVTVHEFGHFITAKLTGMRVDEFAIGFGPKIYQQRDGETLYSLRAIPLGGYNKIAGMDPDEPVTPDSFKSKSMPKRMLVILAGSLMNFVLPVFLFAAIFFTQGMDKLVDEPIVGSVMTGMPAETAGLREGDRVLSINGKAMHDWKEIVVTLRANGTREVELETERGGSVQKLVLLPEYDEESKRPLIGITPRFTKIEMGFGASVSEGFAYTKNIIAGMVRSLSMMLTGKAEADVSGPLGVAQMAGKMAEKGLLPLMNFVAFLSINLGVINLLPLPALDGGHIVLLVLEMFRGKPLGSKAMYNVQMAGVALILALTVFSTMKDLTR